MKNQKISTKRIAMAGLLAALTCVGSALRITVPADLVGTSSIHLGNIFCALSGLLLGPGMGGLAAGLGSAIYDMTNPLYIGEAWLTFLMKGAYGLAAGLVFKHLKVREYVRDLLGTTAGAVTYAVLYLGKTCLKGMIDCSHTLGGTAYSVFKGYPIKVASKTGTAEHDQIGRTNNGAFICFAPAENPRIAIAVYGEYTGSGGRLANVAKAIMDVYFSTELENDVPTYENKVS